MADTKISALTAYTPALDTDVIPIVDLTTATTKKITKANFLLTIPSATTATTQSANDNSTKLATTAYINSISLHSAKAYLANGSANQTIANNTDVKITLDTENWDLSNEFASNKYTATTAGYYIVTTGVIWVSPVATKIYETKITVNGTDVSRNSTNAGGTVNFEQTNSAIIHLNANDYVELFVYQNSGASSAILFSIYTNMAIQRLS